MRLSRSGPDAGDEFAVGDRVGIAWLRHTCGQCKFCARGQENLCPRSRYTGWDADGGYAEFATVPAAFAHRLPAGYSPTAAGAAAVRRHHRLPRTIAGRAARRWTAWHLWLRWQRASHRSGGTGAGRRGARDDPRCEPRNWRWRWVRRRLKAPRTARRSSLTPRSCSLRSAILCCLRSRHSTAAARWRSPASISPTSRH